jgi:hypothetical protein
MVQIVLAEVILRQIGNIGKLDMRNIRRSEHADVHIRSVLVAGPGKFATLATWDCSLRDGTGRRARKDCGGGVCAGFGGVRAWFWWVEDIRGSCGAGYVSVGGQLDGVVLLS